MADWYRVVVELARPITAEEVAALELDLHGSDDLEGEDENAPIPPEGDWRVDSFWQSPSISALRYLELLPCAASIFLRSSPFESPDPNDWLCSQRREGDVLVLGPKSQLQDLRIEGPEIVELKGEHFALNLEAVKFLASLAG